MDRSLQPNEKKRHQAENKTKFFHAKKTENRGFNGGKREQRTGAQFKRLTVTPREKIQYT